jgi:hypothetical protein
MPFNAAGRGSRGEIISHFTGVTMRLVGDGEFKMRLSTFEDAAYQDLLPFQMSSTPGREPFRLANFNAQRTSFKGYTTDIDEVFEVNRIVLFGKDLWAEYPGIE